MRLRSAVPLGLILASVGMIGQTPVKSVAGAEPKTESASLSDHDKNIEAYIELIRTDLRKDKAQVMAAVLQLDGDEAAKFWPIYKDFEAELTQIYDVVVAQVTDYAANYDKMTPDLADQLANKLLDLEQQRNDLKRKYYRQFKGALDPIIAARFLQVENQIERLLDLQIASELPVVGRNQP